MFNLKLKQKWIERLRTSQHIFQEKLKEKLYGINMNRQTNKHSKLLSNTNSTETLSSTKISDIDFNTCELNPLNVKISENTTLANESIANLKDNSKSDIKPNQNLNNNKTNVSINNNNNNSNNYYYNNDNSLTNLELLSKEKSLTTQSTSNSPNMNSPFSKLNILNTKYSTFPATLGTNDFCEPIQNAIPLTRIFQTHIKFPFEVDQQKPFSPPLSPILHNPCAHFRLDVTIPNPYNKINNDLLSTNKSNLDEKYVYF